MPDFLWEDAAVSCVHQHGFEARPLEDMPTPAIRVAKPQYGFKNPLLGHVLGRNGGQSGTLGGEDEEEAVMDGGQAPGSGGASGQRGLQRSAHRCKRGRSWSRKWAEDGKTKRQPNSIPTGPAQVSPHGYLSRYTQFGYNSLVAFLWFPCCSGTRVFLTCGCPSTPEHAQQALAFNTMHLWQLLFLVFC